MHFRLFIRFELLVASGRGDRMFQRDAEGKELQSGRGERGILRALVPCGRAHGRGEVYTLDLPGGNNRTALRSGRVAPS
jgi:hypothetical protein